MQLKNRLRHFTAKQVRRSELLTKLKNRLIKSRAPAEFQSSEQYWKERYELGGDSGEGSYGELANYKAKTLSDFIEDFDIQSVIEFGSGDGNQASLLPSSIRYLGVDISSQMVDLGNARFKDRNWRFQLMSERLKEASEKNFELAMSLDVIYHLIEDETYDEYLRELFSSSNKFVVIYSSDFVHYDEKVPHVKHRNFTADVENRYPTWKLQSTLKNPLTKDLDSKEYGSYADFFFYHKS